MLTFTATSRTGMTADGISYGGGVVGRFQLRAGAIESVGHGPDNGACILTATRIYIVTESVEQVMEAMGYSAPSAEVTV